MRRSDIPRPSRRASLSFAWRYQPARLCSFLPTVRRRPPSLELSGLAAPRQRFRTGDDRTSQVPGEPSCACALFFDPGRTGRIRPYDAPARPPHWNHGEDSHDEDISGLNSTASALAVYASPERLPPSDARLASRCRPTLRDGIAYPQGPYERFQECFLTSDPPFPDFAWRKVPLPCSARVTARSVAGWRGVGTDRGRHRRASAGWPGPRGPGHCRSGRT